MGRIHQPQTQVKLTNVSVVKLKQKGKRFEIACYKNKVLEWRSKVEKDLDNVLQIHSVFINVSKGQLANSKELKEAFDTENESEIILKILEKGEIQVGEKERSNNLQVLMKEICNLIVEKTVNTDTNRPFTIGIIEKSLLEIHFNPNLTKSAKLQVNEAIRLIQQNNVIPIARVNMKISLTMKSQDAKRIINQIKECFTSIDEEEWDEKVELVGYCEPGQYKILSDLCTRESKGEASMEILLQSKE
jgi:ribosome maturation protein SDO1